MVIADCLLGSRACRSLCSCAPTALAQVFPAPTHARDMRRSRHVLNCAARGRSAYTRDLSLLPALSGCTCSSMRSLSLSHTHSRPQSCVLRAAAAPPAAPGVRMRNLLISALKWQYLAPDRKSGGSNPSALTRSPARASSPPRLAPRSRAIFTTSPREVARGAYAASSCSGAKRSRVVPMSAG